MTLKNKIRLENGPLS